LAWAVEISATAERQMAKLDRAVQSRIVRFLRERVVPSDDPRALGKPLRGERAGLWRFRVGDFRLICEIQHPRLTLLVLYVAHRKEVYR